MLYTIELVDFKFVDTGTFLAYIFIHIITLGQLKSKRHGAQQIKMFFTIHVLYNRLFSY